MQDEEKNYKARKSGRSKPLKYINDAIDFLNKKYNNKKEILIL